MLNITNNQKRMFIVFLLWAFAPLAWILMWKDRKFHGWFPKLLVINGIIFATIFTFQSFGAIDNIISFLDPGRTFLIESKTRGVFYILLAFVLFQIPLGVYLEGFIKRKKYLKDDLVPFIILIFAIDGVIAISTGFLNQLNSPLGVVIQNLIKK